MSSTSFRIKPLPKQSESASSLISEVQLDAPRNDSKSGFISVASLAANKGYRDHEDYHTINEPEKLISTLYSKASRHSRVASSSSRSLAVGTRGKSEGSLGKAQSSAYNRQRRIKSHVFYSNESIGTKGNYKLGGTTTVNVQKNSAGRFKCIIRTYKPDYKKINICETDFERFSRIIREDDDEFYMAMYDNSIRLLDQNLSAEKDLRAEMTTGCIKRRCFVSEKDRTSLPKQKY